MPKTFYALLVGINEYPDPDIPNLKGCIDDIDNLEYFLNGELDQFEEIDIRVLKNKEATYENFVQTFREHLGQAGPDDVVLFHYSGHGSREPAAPEFLEFYPDGWDETLVLYDSRPNGLDLGDKELAVLVNEVAAGGAHVVVSLDSCHSGSGTRSTELKLRQTSDKTQARSLDSYLNGYYVENGPTIPTSKHLLMASCNRYQTAADGTSGGLYSSGLLQVLEEFGTQISYADLFLKARNSVTTLARQKNHSQSPQFEAYGHFNAWSKFLDGSPVGNRDRFSVSWDDENNCWVMGAGAINGLPNDAEARIEVAVFKDRNTTNEPFTFAQTTFVGATKSGLDLSLAHSTDTFYAQLISLPVPAKAIAIVGDKTGIELLKGTVDAQFKNLGLELVELKGKENADIKAARDIGCLFLILCENDTFLLFPLTEYSPEPEGRATYIDDLPKENLLLGVKPFNDNTAIYLLRVLEKALKWSHSLSLNNNRPQLNPDDLDFELWLNEAGKETLVTQNEMGLIPLIFNGNEIRIKVKARNNTPQEVFYTFLYFSADYGIYVLGSNPLDKGLGHVTLWGDGEDDYFFLEEGENQSLERFKLLITTEAADAFLLEQEPVEHLGEILTDPSFRGIGNTRKKEKVKNDWFTKTLMVNIKRS